MILLTSSSSLIAPVLRIHILPTITPLRHHVASPTILRFHELQGETLIMNGHTTCKVPSTLFQGSRINFSGAEADLAAGKESATVQQFIQNNRSQSSREPLLTWGCPAYPASKPLPRPPPLPRPLPRPPRPRGREARSWPSSAWASPPKLFAERQKELRVRPLKYCKKPRFRQQRQGIRNLPAKLHRF